MRWSEAELLATLGPGRYRQAMGLPAAPAVSPLVPSAATPRPAYRSKTEARYAELLALYQHEGWVAYWAYEPIKLRLGESCFYTPDFLVVEAVTPWPIQFHEVKGAFVREDAMVKLRVAATAHPYFAFRMAQWKHGEWAVKEIRAT